MRPSSIAICLCLVPQALFALPPPPPLPPPPDPARLAAAVEIWRDHPLRADALADHAKFKIRQNVVYMLGAAKVRRGGKRWYSELYRLETYFQQKLAAELARNEEAFLQCLATPYAGMSVEQLQQLRAFLASDAGKAFWQASKLSERDGFDCSIVFQDDIDRHAPEGWRMIGATPPPPGPTVD